ncbi:replicase [Beihai barnacle virus 3]|uniref:replicase n=1 Tax=Beihai barnacle virus 3 TaxID=1922361 RepID=UPI00090AACBC|nr:replicase [Beihai barnacle virus 3]APG77565.1 replicase [Beihai barnacle virus 3]
MGSVAKVQNAAYLAAFQANRRANEENVVKLRNALNDEQFQQVQHTALQLGITTQPGKGRSPHPVVTAFTDMAVHSAMQTIGKTNYKNIGPSAAEIIRADNIHCCTIRGDARQEVRDNRLSFLYAEAVAKHNKPTPAHRRHLKEVSRYMSKLPNDDICTVGGHNCKVKASALFLNHSIYDITPDELASAFENSGASIAFATFTCPELLESGSLNGRQGEVVWSCKFQRRTRMQIEWAKMKAVLTTEEKFSDNVSHEEWVTMTEPIKDPKARIYFGMPGVLGYGHSWNNYATWMHAPGVTCSNGITLLIERQRFGAVVLMRIDRTSRGGILVGMPTTTKEMVMIPDLRWMMQIAGELPAFSEVKYHRFPKAIWEQTLRQFMSLSPANRDYVQFTKFAVANVTSLYLGDRRALGWDKDDYSAFTTPAVLVSVYFQVNLHAHGDQDLIKMAKDCEQAFREKQEKTRKEGAFAMGEMWRHVKDVFMALSSPSYEAYEARVRAHASANEIGYIDKRARKNWDFCARMRGIKNIVATKSSRLQDNFRTLMYRGDSIFMSPQMRPANGELMVMEVAETMAAPHVTGVQLRVDGEIHTKNPEEPSTVGDLLGRAFDEYREIVLPPELSNARKELNKAQAENESSRVQMFTAVIDACKIMQEATFDPNWEPVVEMVQGGPGCAKSTYIREQVKDGDTIIVATAAAKVEMMSKLQRHRRDVRVAVNTPHSSVVLADKATPGGTVYIDEYTLQPMGLNIAACQLRGATKIVLVGDYMQIGYVDRELDDQQIETRWRWKELVGRVPEHTLRENYRLPHDHVLALNKRYGYNMVPKSMKQGESSVAYVRDISEVPPSPGYKTVTFRQRDKNSLQHMRHDVNTCHEFQGSTAAFVHLVLRSSDCNRLIEDSGYVVVGTSRHTDALRTTFICDDGVEAGQFPGNMQQMVQLVDLAVQYNGAPVKPTAPRALATQRLCTGRIMEQNKEIFQVDQMLDTWQEEDPLALRTMTAAHAGTQMPEPAVSVRVFPGRFKKGIVTPSTMSYSALSAIRRVAHQGKENASFMLRTFVERNGAARKIMTRDNADVAARLLVDDIEDKLFPEKRSAKGKPEPRITPATSEELQQAFWDTVRNIQKRGKVKAYADGPYLYPTIAEMSCFVKEQTKCKISQWRPDASDSFEVLQNAALTYLKEKPDGSAGLTKEKAGQGVVAWSKIWNIVSAPYAKVMQKRLCDDTHPWFMVASGYSEEDMARKMSQSVSNHGCFFGTKGDDAVMILLKDGEYHVHSCDQTQFDSRQSTLHFSLQDEFLRRLGMPAFIIDSIWKMRERHSVRATDGTILMKNLQFGRDSGEPFTLDGNSLVTIAINIRALQPTVQECELVDINPTSESFEAAQDLFDMVIKHEFTHNIGEFIGYIFVAEANIPKFVPNIVKRVTKELGRAYKPQDVKSQNKLVLQELREMGVHGHEEYFGRLAEVATATEDFLALLADESDVAITIEANLRYHKEYLSTSRHAAATACLRDMISFLNALADKKNIGWFSYELAKNFSEKPIHYVNIKEACQENEYYFLSPNEENELLNDIINHHAHVDIYNEKGGAESPALATEVVHCNVTIDEAAMLECAAVEEDLDLFEEYKNICYARYLGRELPLCDFEGKWLQTRKGKQATRAGLNSHTSKRYRVTTEHVEGLPELVSFRAYEAFDRIVTKLGVYFLGNRGQIENGGVIAARLVAAAEHWGQRGCVVYCKEREGWTRSYTAGGERGGVVFHDGKRWYIGKAKPRRVSAKPAAMTRQRPAPPEEEVTKIMGTPRHEPDPDFLLEMFHLEEQLRTEEDRRSYHSDGSEERWGTVRDRQIDIDFRVGKVEGVTWMSAPASGTDQCFYDAVNAVTMIPHEDLKCMLARVNPNESRVYKSATEKAPASAPEDLMHLGYRVVAQCSIPGNEHVIEGGDGAHVYLNLVQLSPGCNHWLYGVYDVAPDVRAAPMRERMNEWEREQKYDENGTYRGYKSKRGGAASKIEDCIAPIAGYIYKGGQNSVIHMIGEAPGYAAEALAMGNGVSTVHAYSLPPESGGLHWRADLDAAVVTHDVDLMCMEKLPAARLATCDLQNASVRHFEKFSEITAECDYRVFKVMDVFDSTASRIECEGWKFVKPRRSNAMSAEVYAIDFDHPYAMNLSMAQGRLCAAWDRDVVSVLVPHPDNVFNSVSAPEWCVREVVNLGIPVGSDEAISEEVSELWEIMMRSGCVPRRPIAYDEGADPEENYILVPGKEIRGPLGVDWVREKSVRALDESMGEIELGEEACESEFNASIGHHGELSDAMRKKLMTALDLPYQPGKEGT